MGSPLNRDQTIPFLLSGAAGAAPGPTLQQEGARLCEAVTGRSLIAIDIYADVVELADTQDLGSCAKA